MCPDEPICQPQDHAQSDIDMYAVSPWGHGPLVGSTAMISPLHLSPVMQDAAAVTHDASMHLDLFMHTTSLYQHATGYYNWD